MPWPYRNGVAASLPVGISLVLAAGGVLLPNDGPFGWLSLAMGAATLLGFLVGVWALIRPPRFLQAPWLLADQERRKRGLPWTIPVPSEGKRPTMTARAFAVSALGFATFALVWLALGFPPGPILIGLAITLPAVAATRLRRSGAVKPSVSASPFLANIRSPSAWSRIRELGVRSVGAAGTLAQ